MKTRILFAIALLLAVAASSSVLSQSRNERTSLIAVANTAPQAGEKLTAGDSVAAANFAWLLFVQAMKPANGSLTFESWTEQNCLIQPQSCAQPATEAEKGKRHHLHKSPLRIKNTGAKAAAAAEDQCGAGSSMNAPSPETTPVFQGFFPEPELQPVLF